MSKKSRENSSKTPASKAPRAGVKSAVKKTAPAAAKAATKTTVKKAVVKAVRPAAKAAAKTVKTPVTKSIPKSIPKPTAKLAVAKAAPKRAAAPKPATTGAKAPAKASVAAAPAVAIVGAAAPAFSLPRDGGASVALTDYAGKKLVIFFYPRANTPGCTREAIDFTRLASDFAAVQTAVLGVSADPLKAQESFRDKHDLTIPLLSDETHAMLEAYGAWGEKSMYGKSFQGVFRTTVLIGKDGLVAQIWRNVKVDGHAEAVLDAARHI